MTITSLLDGNLFFMLGLMVSLVITYISCSKSNLASTVLKLIQERVNDMGLPERVCSDHGGENIDINYDEHFVLQTDRSLFCS